MEVDDQKKCIQKEIAKIEKEVASIDSKKGALDK